MSQTNGEDEKLIRAYQAGDLNALNTLFKKYCEKTYRLLRLKGLPAPDAEDAAQDIFARMIKTLKNFKFKARFTSYLNTAIRNKAIEYYKQRRNNLLDSLWSKIFNGNGEESNEIIETVEAGKDAKPDEMLAYHELLAAVRHCLKTIKHDVQRLLTTLWLQGFKQREMADLLKIPPGSVGGNLHRGKEIFRNCIKKNGF